MHGFLILIFFLVLVVVFYFIIFYVPHPPPLLLTLCILHRRHYFQIALGAGLGLIGYAALAGGDAWKEFIQYFKESKFVCFL